MLKYINYRNFFKALLLLVFSSRILLGYFHVWFSWMPLTWFMSPSAYMFTLPAGTSVNTEYLIVNKNTQAPVINLLKRNSQSFLFENQTSSQLIYVLLRYPKESPTSIKAKAAFERLACRGLTLKGRENFLIIKDFEKITYKEEINCEKIN